MAINVNFNGATIWKAGSYSKFTIDTGGVFNLGPTGIVAIFGEAEGGKPGSAEDIVTNWYTPDEMPAIRSKYKSGPIVDACSYLFAPANDAAIPSGAQAVYIYKTNASTQASLALANTYGTVLAKQYGTEGNAYTYKNTITEEVPASIASSATFDIASAPIAAGSKFSIHIDGSQKYTFTAEMGGYDTTAALDTGLNTAANWAPSSPLGLPFTIEATGANNACSVEIRMHGDAEGVVTNQLDHSRSIELIDEDDTPLAIMNIDDSALIVPSVEAKALIQLKNIQDTYTESESLGGTVILNVGYNDTSTDAATIEVTNTSVILRVGSSTVATFIKTAYPTLGSLVTAINLVSPYWNAALTSSVYQQTSVTRLDHCGEIGCISSGSHRPARIRRNAYEVASFFNESSLCKISNQNKSMLPDALIETTLSGGAVGGTSSADIANALEKFTEIDVNVVVPLFSRDATYDIDDYMTDPASSYTIDSILQSVKTHLSVMGTTKKRSERQAVCSYKDTYENCKIASGTIADGKIQLVIQDIKQIDSTGMLKWMLPWALSCLVTGARCGSPIGTPLLFKYLNCSGIRHTAQSMLTADDAIVEDFNPRTQYEDAIQSGITFLERPTSGGFRVVCDNTTYGVDDNWVWNRGNVIYAAFVLMKDFRRQLENIYIGLKNTISAAEVESTCDTVLRTYLAQGITVSVPGAVNGFRGLSVKIVGNTIYIYVTIILVEGIEWILTDFKITRAISEA